MSKHARLFSTSRHTLSWHVSFTRLRASAKVLAGLTVLVSTAALAPRARAQNTNLYWDTNGATTGLGGTGTWDTTTMNWSTDSAGASPTTTYTNTTPSTVTADFGGTAGTVTLGTGVAIYVNTIQFDTAIYTIAGASGANLNFSGTTPGIVNSSGNLEYINAALAGSAGLALSGNGTTIFGGNLSGLTGTVNVGNRVDLDGTTLTGSQNQTWNIASGQTLSTQNHGVTSTVQLGALTGTGTLRIGNNGIGTADSGTDTFQIGGLNLAADTFGGTITDHTTTALTAITKVGTGTLTLTNTNTYTGGTLVSGGTLSLATGGGAGAIRGVVTVSAGATLNLASGDALGYNAGTQVTTINLNSGTITSTAGNNEGYLTSYNLTGGTVSAGSLFRFSVNASPAPTISSLTSGTTSTFAANIDDFPTGTGTVGNLGVSVATGTTANGIDLTISGVIGSGGGLTKTGSGYLNLTGQNTFTGPVTVSAGTLNVGTGGTGTASALGADSTTKAIMVSSGAILSGTINNWFGTGTQNNGGGVSTLPTITLNGGTLSTTRYTAIGALNLNGGTVTAASTDNNANFQAFALAGNVTVGGTTPSTITSTNVGTNTGGYHLGNNAGKNTTFTVASTGGTGADLTVSAPLLNQSGDFGGGAAGLTKAGAGVMALTAGNTYTGPTAVTAGTLLVTGSTAAGSAVTVNNSGTILGGTGTVAGTVNVGNGAIISAGNGVQSLTGKLTTGALTLQTGSTFNALLASSTSFSTLSAAGTTALGNAAFSINTTPGATFTNGQVLELITSPASGNFTNTTYTAGGYTFTADYTTNSGFFDVDIAAVPEPATWLSGFLLLGTVGMSQRRKLAGWFNLARA